MQLGGEPRAGADGTARQPGDGAEHRREDVVGGDSVVHRGHDQRQRDDDEHEPGDRLHGRRGGRRMRTRSTGPRRTGRRDARPSVSVSAHHQRRRDHGRGDRERRAAPPGERDGVGERDEQVGHERAAAIGRDGDLEQAADGEHGRDDAGRRPPPGGAGDRDAGAWAARPAARGRDDGRWSAARPPGGGGRGAGSSRRREASSAAGARRGVAVRGGERRGRRGRRGAGGASAGGDPPSPPGIGWPSSGSVARTVWPPERRRPATRRPPCSTTRSRMPVSSRAVAQQPVVADLDLERRGAVSAGAPRRARRRRRPTRPTAPPARPGRR